MAEKEEDLRIARSEAEDYRVTEAQSWRNLVIRVIIRVTFIWITKNDIMQIELLVACTRLYKSLCRSVGLSVGRSVTLLVFQRFSEF